MKKEYRPFIKYIQVDDAGRKRLIRQDSSYTEHQKAMSWKNDVKYKEQFLKDNYNGGNRPIYVYSWDYLNTRTVELISKYLGKGNLLSLGSGGCGIEMKLHEDGYDVTCSDIEVTDFHHKLGALFPGAKFSPLDILKTGEIPRKYDMVTAISITYLFSPDQMKLFFANAKKLLKLGGIFMVTIDIAPPNFINNLVLETGLKLDNYFHNLLLWIGGRKKRFLPQEFGWRYGDKYVRDLAGSEGFQLKEFIPEGYGFEIQGRFFIFQMLQRLINPGFIYAILKRLGKIFYMPYRRYFIFELLKI